MGARFLSDAADELIVEIAPGADLRQTPDAWSFVEVTDSVRLDPGIDITEGRPDEGATTNASTCTMTLDNRLGTFSPRNATGTYFGQLARNTPLRVRVKRVTDAFGRTTSNGWGTADTGQAWARGQYGADSELSTDGSVGIIAVNGVSFNRTVWLTATSMRDVEQRVTIRVPQLATGGGFSAGLIARGIDDSFDYYYFCELHFFTDQTMGLQLWRRDATSSYSTTFLSDMHTLSTTHSTSASYTMAFSIVGGNLAARVWDASGSDPGGWQVTADDNSAISSALLVSGRVGCFAYRYALNSNTNPAFWFDDYSATVDLFGGFVSQWPPRWDLSANEANVPIQADGIIRRLTQGNQVLKSALYRSTTGGGFAAELADYWSFEDATGSTQAANAVGGFAMKVTAGSLTYGDFSDAPAGSDPVATFGSASRQRATSATIPAGAWSVSCAYQMPVSSPNLAPDIRVTATGTWWGWAFTPTAGGLIQFVFFDDTSTTTLQSTSTLNDGGWHYLAATVVQSGTNQVVTLFVDGVSEDTDTSTATVGRPKQAEIGYDTGGAGNTAHVALWEGALAAEDLATLTDATAGYAGESATARVLRLCAEENIPVIVSRVNGDGEPMGAQRSAGLVDLLREVESADRGVLFEHGFGFGYTPRVDRYNQPVDAPLDVDSGHVTPPEPTDDDQRLRNSWKVSRKDGSSSSFTDTTGPLGTSVGLYDDETTINVETDGVLYQHAAWRVHEGTIDEMRWPSIPLVSLARNTSLIDGVLGLGVGSRVTLDGIPDTGQYDPVDAVVEAKSQHISYQEWTVTLTTSPASVWDVWEVESTTDNLGRADTDGSTLLKALTTTGTSLTVASSPGPKWTTAAGDLPFDIGIAGERMTVTAVADVTASFVGAGTASHGDNASLTPSLHASTAEGDLVLLLAAIRSSGTGAVNTPTGWTLIGDGSNVRLFGKIAASGETAPTVSFSSGAAGDTTSAQTVTFRGVQLVVDSHQVTAQLNASAANIAYPALNIGRDNQLVIVAGWKQDDWTSVATLGGMTEIGEPSSTTGNDQGIVWDYAIQTSATSIASGSFTVTGGTNQISRAIVVALRTDTQTMTVTRSVNGVVKTQAQGADLALWHAPVFAL